MLASCDIGAFPGACGIELRVLVCGDFVVHVFRLEEVHDLRDVGLGSHPGRWVGRMVVGTQAELFKSAIRHVFPCRRSDSPH